MTVALWVLAAVLAWVAIAVVLSLAIGGAARMRDTVGAHSAPERRDERRRVRVAR